VNNKLEGLEDEFVEELLKLEKEGKTLEYYSSSSSDKFCIFSFTINKRIIFELYNIETKNSSFSWIRDQNMFPSHLLNLINRRSQNAGNFKRSI
jgi:hypothetical protein